LRLHDRCDHHLRDNNEIYRMSFVVLPATLAWSWLTVIAAAVVSGVVVRRRLDRLDLVAVLKTQE
jgi:putative ABC transport system permease protein